jgi:hypothetical protein
MVSVSAKVFPCSLYLHRITLFARQLSLAVDGRSPLQMQHLATGPGEERRDEKLCCKLKDADKTTRWMKFGNMVSQGLHLKVPLLLQRSLCIHFAQTETETISTPS